MTTEGERPAERSPDRLRIIERIAEYEREGKFDVDVEDDPPTRPLRPGEADFTGRKFSSKIKTFFANRSAYRYFEGLIKKGDLVIKEVRGEENCLFAKESGAVVTCNHFNPFDNYAVYRALLPCLGKRPLYKVIREGNYTSFPGLYGYFFKNCNTLPIPSDYRLLAEMAAAADELLKRGEKILIYPEQAMWWNYRKPRPLKGGAFTFAAKASVPVLPVFITMTDSDRTGADGFPVQEYTVNILPAILPDPRLTARENAAVMKEKNFAVWKEVYDDFYGLPLSYADGKADG